MHKFWGIGTRSGLKVGGDRSAILVFPFSKKAGASVRKASLILSSDKQYHGSSDVGVFRLTAPFATESFKK